MNYIGKLRLCFGSLGAVFGVIVLAILTKWVGPENFGLVILLPFKMALFFPSMAAFSAVLAVNHFSSKTVGTREGIKITFIAFLYFFLFHCTAALIYAFVRFQDALTLLLVPIGILCIYVFGILIFGIPLLLIGAIGGSAFKKYAP